MRVRVALEAEAGRSARRRGQAVEAKQSAAESAARLKESEQKLQEIKKQKTAEPPAWMTSGAIAPAGAAARDPPAQRKRKRNTPSRRRPGFEFLPTTSNWKARRGDARDAGDAAETRATRPACRLTGNGRELLIQGLQLGERAEEGRVVPHGGARAAARGGTRFSPPSGSPPPTGFRVGGGGTCAGLHSLVEVRLDGGPPGVRRRAARLRGSETWATRGC